tara:strand:+ start:1786 stop:2256 length:471 start_codon:yes stop_codon:yes gene_type:complete
MEKEDSANMTTPFLNLQTEVELLKREVSDMKQIHIRLDKAIDKITDVSNSIHAMLAVHEEKISRQEDAISENEQNIVEKRKELLEDIKDLHSRITKNNIELTDKMLETERTIIAKNASHINELRQDLTNRVGVLEKWRWVIIGGSIVAGFMIDKFM